MTVDRAPLDCRSPEGEAVQIIDSAILLLRLAARIGVEHPAVTEALRDLGSDPEVRSIVDYAQRIARRCRAT